MSRVNFDAVKAAATGSWPGIFARLGISVGDGRHCPCPICGGKDRFRCDDKGGEGTWICGQCGAGNGFQLVQKVLGGDWPSVFEAVNGIVHVVPKNEVLEERPVDPATLRKMAQESAWMQHGDPVHQYLVGRGLKNMGTPLLRYGPKIWNAEIRLPVRAMLAYAYDQHGQAVSIHRTYIDAKKLGIKTRKKYMPGLKPMSGGSMRIYPWEHGPLGVTEGIENAIAAYEYYNIPFWPIGDAGKMEKFIPPPGCDELIIIGDNDSHFRGQRAAYTLGNKCSIWKKKVEVWIPPEVGMDFLDWKLAGNGGWGE